MLRILSVLCGLAVIGFAIGAYAGAAPVYLPLLAAALAVVLHVSGGLPKVMRFLSGLFALSFLVLGALTFATGLGLVPQAALPYLPPPSSAIIAAILAAVN